MIYSYSNDQQLIAVLNNPAHSNILDLLKDRCNFSLALHEYSPVDGVCVGHIFEKAGLSQSPVSNYIGLLKQSGLIYSERHGQWFFYCRNADTIGTFLTILEKEPLMSYGEEPYAYRHYVFAEYYIFTIGEAKNDVPKIKRRFLSR